MLFTVPLSIYLPLKRYVFNQLGLTELLCSCKERGSIIEKLDFFDIQKLAGFIDNEFPPIDAGYKLPPFNPFTVCAGS
jgi:hypothetical protein